MLSKLSESITVQVAPGPIFELTQDYGQRLAWDTFLKKAELIDAGAADVGVKAWCVSKHGLGMETEYVSFKRPKVTAVTQTKRSTLFKKFSGSWIFEELDQQSTKVIFTYSYILNFPFSLAKRFIHNSLTKNVRQRLKDLKSYVEQHQQAANTQ